MRTFSRIAVLFLLLARVVSLPAQTNISPGRVAVKAAAPPSPGRALVVDLGANEFLPFAWIGPLQMWVGKFEVTTAQYQRFDMGHVSPDYYGHELDAPDQPVVWVSWEDANNYCAWLTRTCSAQIPGGYIFRLPTEREWQAFAACGEHRRYPWGNNWPPPGTFNYRGKEGVGFFYWLFQSENYIGGHDDGFIVTCPVTRSGGNAWGLFGVGGNVWEWCQDWFDDRQITRSLRGASWNNSAPEIIAINNRSDAHPLRSNAMIGFRVVVAPAAIIP